MPYADTRRSHNLPTGHRATERHHLTSSPGWLERTPTPASRYALVGFMAFEATPGLFFGWHIDRIGTDGTYLGETTFVPSLMRVQHLMGHWAERADDLGGFTEEDVFGDQDGRPTTVAQERMASGRRSQVRRQVAA